LIDVRPALGEHRLELLAAALFLLASTEDLFARTDPSTGRCRTIWVGEICNNNQIALDLISAEPRFTLTRAVPCCLQYYLTPDAKKFARMYLPRSYDSLCEGTDIMVFHDFSPEVLPSGYLEWFRRAVEEGIGLCLIEFANRAATYSGMNFWPEVTLYQVFAGDMVPNQAEAFEGRQFYRIVQEGRLLELPGLEARNMNWGAHGDLSARAGSTLWAVWRERGTPALLSRPYGQGIVIQPDHGWDTIPEDTKRQWEYFPDYIFNHLTFVGGLSFPDDLELVHRARAAFIRYNEEKGMALLFLGFIEKFGANPLPFEQRLGEMTADHKQAEELYIDLRVAESLEIMQDLLDQFVVMDEDMMRARDRALFWVFVTQYLVVAATSMGCGFALWTLMVKRRLYREARATKARRSTHRAW